MTSIILAAQKNSRCREVPGLRDEGGSLPKAKWTYRCVNANCPAKLLGTILHFASAA